MCTAETDFFQWGHETTNDYDYQGALGNLKTQFVLQNC